jgi:2-polyprenyl-3-methyl-5-hydroxy-6-metoxy-1,4-benzoquinol methylase
MTGSAGTVSDFPETADIETASEAYAARFGGPVGAWMLRVQENATRSLLHEPGGTILDVGGGHGQLAGPLCRAGYGVTVTGSDASCAHRIRGELDAGTCRFVIANSLSLPFPGGAFDVVLCFRLITHAARWPDLIRELCRVARVAVIAEYPTSQSLNRIAPALFKAKKSIEGNTRPWRLFRHSEIDAEFGRNGFAPERRTGQFFLPIVLHRALRVPALSRSLEGACAAVGLARRFGSPVIVRMTRRAAGMEAPGARGASYS